MEQKFVVLCLLVQIHIHLFKAELFEAPCEKKAAKRKVTKSCPNRIPIWAEVQVLG